MMGRLGNQFFQYAFAKALQQKFCPNYAINISFTKAKGLAQAEKDDVQGWQKHNVLKDFNVTANFTDRPFSDKLHYYTFHSMFTVMRKLLPEKVITSAFTGKLVQALNVMGVYVCPTSRHYYAPSRPRVRNVSVTGYFEAYEYFDSIRDILLEEFTPKHDVMPHNRAMLEAIKGSESVCVHVRRGDFLKLSVHNVCSEEYFCEAMKAVRKERPECRFFVFSDDVEAVRSSMHLPFDVSFEDSHNPSGESMHMMMNCKHFIISNSTFSWWAQYLSRNEGKIVYAPSVWHKGERDSSGVYLPYMRKLEC